LTIKDLSGRPIRRVRGDTAPDQITIDDIDITGFSYTLTVDTLRNPEDETTQLVQITGTIVETGPPAIVSFPWTAEQADQESGDCWYDIEQIDSSGKLKTIAKNKYSFDQDITK
jgi:hypothetical protein